MQKLVGSNPSAASRKPSLVREFRVPGDVQRIRRPSQRRRQCLFSAHSALHEGSQALSFAIFKPHRTGVDAQGKGGVGVAKLDHDLRRRLSEEVQDALQDARESAPQSVRGESVRQGQLAGLVKSHVGPVDRLRQDAGADIRLRGAPRIQSGVEPSELVPDFLRCRSVGSLWRIERGSQVASQWQSNGLTSPRAVELALFKRSPGSGKSTPSTRPTPKCGRW